MWLFLFYLWSIVSFYVFTQAAAGEAAIVGVKDHVIGLLLIAIWPIYPFVALYQKFYIDRK